MKTTFTVLFVCAGNTCRSPMAEALLRAELARVEDEQNLARVHVRSAGLEAGSGDRVSSEARAAVGRLGIRMARRSARPLTERRFRSADLVLAMTESQKHRIWDRWPDAREKTFVVSEFSGWCRGSVPDPIGGSDLVYDACARRLRSEIRKMVPRLSRLAERRIPR